VNKLDSPVSVKSLGKPLLQRKAEPAFLGAGLLSQSLYLSMEDVDSVRLYGLVNSSEKKERIETVLKETKEIKKMTNDVTIFKSPSGRT